jgi:Tfp pilus assembly protein PilF
MNALQSIDLARKSHQSGDFHRAEQLCQELLGADPRNAEGWALLASASQAQGKLAEASTSYRRALEVRPDSAEVCFNLARVLAAQGKPEEAIRSYRQAIGLKPDHADALANLGLLLAEQGSLEAGISMLRQATRYRPDFAKAHHNLGVTFDRLGKREEAEKSIRQALHLKPDYSEAHYNLGNVLAAQGKQKEALASYREAVRHQPDFYQPLNNLGLGLVDTGELTEAVVFLQQAARLRPDTAEVHNNLGLALAELGRFAEAEACFHKALQIEPKHVTSHTNLGNVYKDQARLEEALTCYEMALWLDPESASTHWNRALAWLQAGNFEKGWPAYEWRWKRKKEKVRTFRQPLWDGSPLDGRTILLHMEQGLGDMIQFVRYAPLVKQLGGTVILECSPLLAKLFARCAGIDRMVTVGAPLPDFDVHAPLMSLPALLKTTLRTIPNQTPYLYPEEERVQAWGQKLRAAPEFKIGIGWQGNPNHRWDRHRSVPLACFAPLARLPCVRLISLQKRGLEEENLKDLAKRLGVTEPEGDWDPPSAPFADSAAIVKHLDLVIAVDTALAHLAGALAVPVWVPLSAMTDWRWLLDREDSPWYPTMRLFRQAKLGEWQPVFESMARELEKLIAGMRQSQPIEVELAPGELIDKITILEIKNERITDAAKLIHVRTELAYLSKIRKSHLTHSPALAELTMSLKTVNETLWLIEDEIRLCERDKNFGQRFVELARSVYQQNDQRSELKRQINTLLGTRFIEQKSYTEYRK